MISMYCVSCTSNLDVRGQQMANTSADFEAFVAGFGRVDALDARMRIAIALGSPLSWTTTLTALSLLTA